MGTAVEVSTALPSSEYARQPAFGTHVDYPELKQGESDTEECAADRFARRIQWPALLFLASLETAWLLALAYLVQLLIG